MSEPADPLAEALCSYELSPAPDIRKALALRALELSKLRSPLVQRHVTAYLHDSGKAFSLRRSGMVSKALECEGAAEYRVGELRKLGISW